ncbi:hypothetical protein [Arcicella rosea]|uniref:Uncharacterized protein n=1 Tax=Arcicella rosea TaxID=502909 RepID=A0A841EMM7_9BACT|nr:hypothetical protein [Arcicella rosea]MBB6001998.1 hypothetical protein [Arcicella rosea]
MGNQLHTFMYYGQLCAINYTNIAFYMKNQVLGFLIYGSKYNTTIGKHRHHV